MRRYVVPRTNPYTVPRTNPVRLRAGERIRLEEPERLEETSEAQGPGEYMREFCRLFKPGT